LRTVTAAQSRICLSSRVLAYRHFWLAAWFCLAASCAGAQTPAAPAAADPASASSYLIVARLDLSSLESVIEDHTATAYGDAQQPQPAQQQFVIDRIDFLGNRRIRSDTLKARIFSREGDNYNEETLRRDFQALWNTQFFE